MKYIQEELGFNLIIAKTGVKYLHQKAIDYDLAIYFESNGHGTVYSSPNVRGKIETLNSFIESSSDCQTLELISMFLSMFNPTVGDSLSVIIAVECALRMMNKSILDIYELYEELEAVNMKVFVKDKSVYVPNDDETKLLQPVKVQEFIEEITGKYKNSRCFVRPSGTEDVVRIYAEAENVEAMNKICCEVRDKLY